MSKTLILAVIWFLFIVNTLHKPVRIAGGKKAKKHQFPFFTQIETLKSYSALNVVVSECGASLIHPQWIISAAHCFPMAFKPVCKPVNHIINVYMGTNLHFGADAVRNTIVQIHYHPEYVAEIDSDGFVMELQNDVAIAKLQHAYDLNERVKVIKLPEPNTKRCRFGTIIGVGLTGKSFHESVLFTPIKSKEISELQVVIPAPSADTVFYSEVQWLGGHVMEGDSGGPFVCYRNGSAVLYGVTSIGRSTMFDTEITAYEDVTKHLKFIRAKDAKEKTNAGLNSFNLRFRPFLIFLIYFLI